MDLDLVAAAATAADFANSSGHQGRGSAV